MSKTLPHTELDSVCFERAKSREYTIVDGHAVRMHSASVDALAHLPASTVARRLVEALLANGVDTFCSVPGGSLSLIADVIRTTPGATLLESHHESAAMLAAVAYHRASGKVPCVFVTAGPGITNVATGVASAHLEGIPLLLLCGDAGRSAVSGARPARIHVESILGSLVRHTERVYHPGTAVTQVLHALRAAKSLRGKAPALVVCPVQYLMHTAPAVDIEHAAVEERVIPERRVVLEVMSLLSQAKRPLLVLGAGCRGNEAAVRDLVSIAGVPFITTPRAKGVVKETHPFSLRNGGAAASLWARHYTAAAIDVTLVLGSDLDDSAVGLTPYVGGNGQLVHVDLDGRVFNRNVPTTLAIQADLRELARIACEVILENDLKHRTAHEEVARIRLQSPHEQPDFADDERMPLTPQRALADLENAVTDDARFITDVGEHASFALHYLTAHHPQRFHTPLHLDSVGSSIASAIGLAMGCSNPIVCLCGDDGLPMKGAEVLSAKRRGLRILYAVFNDGRSGSHDIDFVQWADSMGMPAARIERPGQISAELLTRLSVDDGPVLLDIRIDREQRLWGAARVESANQ